MGKDLRTPGPLPDSVAHTEGASPMFDSIPDALAAIRNGECIVVVDDERRENEGDLICAAQFATPEQINFMATDARGLICLAMEGERLDALDLPLMVDRNTDSNQTAFTVSIDAGPENGVSTGISADDRSRTIQVAIQPGSKPSDLRRPGHIFPLRARPGGVLKRAGHTEAAVDLAQMSGLYPSGVICEIQNPDGSMARLPELTIYARERGLKLISIEDLIRYRLDNERFVVRSAQCSLPTEFGSFLAIGYSNELDGSEHVALVKGDPNNLSEPVLVRMHSECLTGDAFGSMRCDCRAQLHTAMKHIEKEGEGVVVYLRQEGRGIGLINKFKAYSLQEGGLDTVEANEKLGFAPDLRNYGVGAQILSDLGIHRLNLLTNNPRKIAGLGGYGLEVVNRVPMKPPIGDFNARYLATKKEKLGHLLDAIELSSHWVLCLDSNSTDDGVLSDLLHRVEQLSETSGLQLHAEQGPRLLALWERPRFVWSLQVSEPDTAAIKSMLITMAGWAETSRLGLLHTVNEQQITHPPQTLERKELKRSSLADASQDTAWFPEGNQAALLHWS